MTNISSVNSCGYSYGTVPRPEKCYFNTKVNWLDACPVRSRHSSVLIKRKSHSMKAINYASKSSLISLILVRPPHLMTN